MAFLSILSVIFPLSLFLFVASFSPPLGKSLLFFPMFFYTTTVSYCLIFKHALEVESCCVDHAGLELPIFLLHLSEHSDYRDVLPCVAPGIALLLKLKTSDLKEKPRHDLIGFHCKYKIYAKIMSSVQPDAIMICKVI